jgi:hypothetical protein
MPKILEINGYKFFFYSNEGFPFLERMHVHIRKGERIAKFYLKPEIQISNNYGFSSKELNWIENEIYKNQIIIEEKWNEYFKNRR